MELNNTAYMVNIDKVALVDFVYITIRIIQNENVPLTY